MRRWADHPYVVLAIVACSLVFAFLLGHRGGTEYYQVASETSRIVQLDEPPVPASEYDALLLVLDKEAVELAYKHHIERLFSTWMADSTGQPQRAVNGARKAKRAYIDIMRGIEARGKTQ